MSSVVDAGERSPAVTTPTTHEQEQRHHQPEVAPAPVPAAVRAPAGRCPPAPRPGSHRRRARPAVGRGPSTACRPVRASALPASLTRASLHDQVEHPVLVDLGGRRLVRRRGPRGSPAPGRPGRGPPGSRWRPRHGDAPRRPAAGPARRSRCARRRRRRGSARRAAAPGSPRSSQRASTTFCWLPPESVRTARVDVGGPDVERRGHLGRAPRARRRRRRKPAAGEAAQRRRW